MRRSLDAVGCAVAVCRAEYRLSAGRFAFWLLIVVAILVGGLYFTPYVRVWSGDSSLIQQVPLARNSAFSLAIFMAALSIVLLPFTISLASETAGRDGRDGVLDLTLVSPISRAAYLLGKIGALAAAALTPPLAFVATVLVVQGFPAAGVGTLSPNLIGATVGFVEFWVPFTLAVTVGGFAVTALSGRPKIAYACVPGFLIAYISCWVLASKVEYRWLVSLDPVGLLQLAAIGASGRTNSELNQLTWVTEPSFLFTRAALVGCTCAIVVWTCLRYPIGGPEPVVPVRRRVVRRATFTSTWAPAVDDLNRSKAAFARPGWHGMREVLAIACAELRLTRHERALFLFLPVFLILVWRSLGVPVGPFNAEGRAITVTIVRDSVWLVTLGICALGAFFSIEAGFRDADLRVKDLLRMGPGPTWALLCGKLVGQGGLALVLLCAATGVLVAYQLAHGNPNVRLRPIAELYGGIVLPTVFFALCGSVALVSVLASRQLCYAVAVLVAGGYAWAFASGHRHWLYNVPAAGLFSYSDLLGFGPLWSMVIIQRAYVVMVSAVLVWLAWLLARNADVRGGFARYKGTVTSGCVVAALATVTGTEMHRRVETGIGSIETERLRVGYEQTQKAMLLGAASADVVKVDLDVDLDPDHGRFTVVGTFLLKNSGDAPLTRVYVTVNPRLLANGFIEIEHRAPQSVGPAVVRFELPSPLNGGETATLNFKWSGRSPDGVLRNGGRTTAFVHGQASFLTSVFPWQWLPVVGYSADVEIDDERTRQSYGLGQRTLLQSKAQEDKTIGLMYLSAPFLYSARIRVPQRQQVLTAGTLVGQRTIGSKVEYEFASELPIYTFGIIAGEWVSQTSGSSSVWYASRHPYNADQILGTVVAARELFSRKFGMYPFGTLSVAELPQVGVVAGMAFPGLIPIAEDIGFLTTDSAVRSNVNVFAVSHEVAHQWWGGAFWPSNTRGSFLLTEGLATYSALLFVEQELEEERRQALFRDLERFYLLNRRPDEERPLSELDGSRFTDVPSMYQRAGIVLWMLARLVGEEAMTATLKAFYEEHAFKRIHAGSDDLIDRLAAAGSDKVRLFIDEFIRNTSVPNVMLTDVSKSALPDGSWKTFFSVANKGKGTVDIVLAIRGATCETRTTVRVGPGSPATGSVNCRCEPVALEIDPDASVLLQERHRGTYRL